MSDLDRPVLFFDCVCNLCNSFVNFVIDRDPKGLIRFVSIQSPKGQELLARHGVDASDLDTMYFLEDGKLYDRSTAVCRAARLLRFPWNLLALQRVLPRKIRDFNYNLMAKNRYRLFGKQDSCRVPTPELQARFLA